MGLLEAHVKKYIEKMEKAEVGYLIIFNSKMLPLKSQRVANFTQFAEPAPILNSI